MGDVSRRGGSQEIARPTARPTTIAYLKMEDACNFYNVIEIFVKKK
jgi:hypothetical protein